MFIVASLYTELEKRSKLTSKHVGWAAPFRNPTCNTNSTHWVQRARDPKVGCNPTYRTRSELEVS